MSVTLDWEAVKSEGLPKYGHMFLDKWIYRAQVPGGWLVTIAPMYSEGGTGIVFVPDPKHMWKEQES